jgi:hypothetical protein
VADSAVVSGSPGAGLRRSPYTEADVVSPSLSARDSPPTSVDEIAPASRLEIIRKYFHLQGFLKSPYGSAWRNWVDWCLRRSENPLSPPLSSVLEFLASLNTEGKAYSTINVHRSMLSSTLPHIDNRPSGQHPLVESLMSGCYNINPPKPKYNSNWDPDLVVGFV